MFHEYFPLYQIKKACKMWIFQFESLNFKVVIEKRYLLFEETFVTFLINCLMLFECMCIVPKLLAAQAGDNYY